RGLLQPVTALRLTRGSYVAGWGMEAMPLAKLNLWYFDAATQVWRIRLAAPPVSSDSPSTLRAGDAFYSLPNGSTLSLAPAASLTIRFYHQDHLRSSSVLTDAAGAIIEETVNYAYGHPRFLHQPGSVAEPYSFTQKERDSESGLTYF